MRKVLYGLILACLLFAPLERLDVGDLEPVEVVAVYAERDRVILETDTGDRGEGADAPEALVDMKHNTPTVIYLDTAEFLLIAPGSEDHAEMLREELHGGVKVAPYNGGDLKEEAQYADLHNDLPRLRQWNSRP